MAKRQEITKSEFYCVECGRRGIPIARKVGKQREAGHLKKLYCLYCLKETNHCEIRPFGTYTKEDFEEEYFLGRFINGKRVEIKDLEICRNRACQFNKHGRCWNANNSFKCDKRRTKNEC